MTTPQLIEVIEAAIADALEQVFTCIPAEVQFYDPILQLATVQPVIQRKLPNGDFEHYPCMQQVPVVFPNGGGYSMTFPLKKHDIVILMFAQDDYSTWMVTGKIRAPSFSYDYHGLSNAFCLAAGFNARTSLRPPTATSLTDVVIGAEDGSMQIRITPEGIKLGGAEAVDFVALASKVMAELQAIQEWCNAHTHAVSGGTAGVSMPSIDPIGSVGAAKVRAV